MSIVVAEMSTLLLFLNKRDDGKAVSYALATYDKERDAAVLWHVHTDPDHRRAGHAREIIEGMKSQFDIIVTGVNAHAGNELVKCCGFELMQGDITNESPMLIWVKT